MKQKSYGGYFGDLNVYGWVIGTGDLQDADAYPPWAEWAKTNKHIGQARCVIAAKSKADAARKAGFARPSQMWNLGETGNVIECGVALNTPGVVFWVPLSNSSGLPYLRKLSETELNAIQERVERMLMG